MNPSYGDSEATVQSKIGKPDTVDDYGTSDAWNYIRLGTDQYSPCALQFQNGTLSTYDDDCMPGKINFGTFGVTPIGASAPESGKALSKNISETTVYNKWGVPDSISYDSSTSQTWNYVSEGSGQYSPCSLHFESGLVSSFGTQCAVTDIDVTTF